MLMQSILNGTNSVSVQQCQSPKSQLCQFTHMPIHSGHHHHSIMAMGCDILPGQGHQIHLYSDPHVSPTTFTGSMNLLIPYHMTHCYMPTCSSSCSYWVRSWHCAIEVTPISFGLNSILEMNQKDGPIQSESLKLGDGRGECIS